MRGSLTTLLALLGHGLCCTSPHFPCSCPVSLTAAPVQRRCSRRYYIILFYCVPTLMIYMPFFQLVGSANPLLLVRIHLFSVPTISLNGPSSLCARCLCRELRPHHRRYVSPPRVCRPELHTPAEQYHRPITVDGELSSVRPAPAMPLLHCSSISPDILLTCHQIHTECPSFFLAPSPLTPLRTSPHPPFRSTHRLSQLEVLDTAGAEQFTSLNEVYIKVCCHGRATCVPELTNLGFRSLAADSSSFSGKYHAIPPDPS